MPSRAVLEFEGGQCAHKLALADDIQAAVREIAAIQNDEIQAVLSGDYEASERIRASIRRAQEQKSLLIERYRQHVSDHGC